MIETKATNLTYHELMFKDEGKSCRNWSKQLNILSSLEIH